MHIASDSDLNLFLCIIKHVFNSQLKFNDYFQQKRKIEIFQKKTRFKIMTNYLPYSRFYGKKVAVWEGRDEREPVIILMLFDIVLNSPENTV